MQMNEYLPLNFGIEELVKAIAAEAQVPPHVLIARIINNRWQEMEELLYALEQQPVGSQRYSKIRTLISEYAGGGYIYDELKSIDPDYLTPEEDADIPDGELTGLMDLLEGEHEAVH